MISIALAILLAKLQLSIFPSLPSLFFEIVVFEVSSPSLSEHVSLCYFHIQKHPLEKMTSYYYYVCVIYGKFFLQFELKKNIHLFLFIRVKYELQFKNIILLKNNISQEMIQKIREHINYIKISLIFNQRSKENIRILLANLNYLKLDLCNAAKL
jgi:hypothetical protein